MGQPQSIESTYDRLADDFFDIYYTYYPVHATRQGLHQYDNSLGHYRRDEIEETLRRMKEVQSRVAAIDPGQMDHQHALDHPVLTTRMKREIFWIEKWRFWENNPLFYKDIIIEGMFNLVSRDFAPLEVRLKALVCPAEGCSGSAGLCPSESCQSAGGIYNPGDCTGKRRIGLLQ